MAALYAKGVTVDVADGPRPQVGWIDPAAFRGIRIELCEDP